MVFLFILLFCVRAAHAGELNLLDVPDKKEKEIAVVKPLTIKEEKENLEYKLFEQQLGEENKQLQRIRTLNLDLEERDLELKKREIEQKLAQFNGSVSGSSSMDKSGPEKGIAIYLKGVFINADKVHALITINGQTQMVKIGDVLSNGTKVIAITKDSMQLRKNDGLNQMINMES